MQTSYSSSEFPPSLISIDIYFIQYLLQCLQNTDLSIIAIPLDLPVSIQ